MLIERRLFTGAVSMFAEALFNIGIDFKWRWYNGVVVFIFLSNPLTRD